MISFTQGNLLKADAEALVNTVNTVGVMGKGIALMFKEAYPENFKAYVRACKDKQVVTGKMFVTRRDALIGPKWIINFPTKGHWRYPSRLEWIEEGLRDLKHVIQAHEIRSIAIPPLGSGNGGLDWPVVKKLIRQILGTLKGVNIVVFEPTSRYQNVAKRDGVEKLTPARALVAEAVRRYTVLGMECTLLEVQKIAYFLERAIEHIGLDNPLRLQFEANRFGPYAPKLTHLLNSLDGSYLHCEKRLADANALDLIWFEPNKRSSVSAYLGSEAKNLQSALELQTRVVDGFESPICMELLATVDWLTQKCEVKPERGASQQALKTWPGGTDAGARKAKLFDARLIELAIKQLSATGMLRHAA